MAHTFHWVHPSPDCIYPSPFSCGRKILIGSWQKLRKQSFQIHQHFRNVL
jgi:hypothetical protein